MKVNGPIGKLGTYEQQKIEKLGEKDKKQAEQTRPESDKVTLSSKAKVYGDVLEAVKSAPDLRAEKIADLKARIEAGEYEPDAAKIAQKLVEEEGEIWS